MTEDIKTKMKNYKTAPLDSRFPNQSQTRNCRQNSLDVHLREKAIPISGVMSPCVYKSLCPMSWVSAWDDHLAEGTFFGKI